MIARQQPAAGLRHEGLPLDPYRVWLILRRTWQVVAVAGVVGAFAGAAVAKKLVKQTFTAHAALSWDTGAPTDRAQRRTLLEAATLATNLEQIARRIHVTPDPVALRRAVVILHSEQSNTIGVEGSWTDAQGAADLANAVVDVLLESRRKQLEFRVVERAKPPRYPAPSARKQVAVLFPLASMLIAAIGVFLWSLRRFNVVTPAEAAFWSKLPVIGASTWPRDPEMLPTLMRDLDDYAPHAEGVILIVGASSAEAELARDVAEWSGYRGQAFGAVDEHRLVDAPGDVDGAYLAIRAEHATSPSSHEGSSMQILTLSEPVPAQSLRRAARLADRVLVVVTSGRHDIFQLRKIRERLGRDEGIGILWVGLPKDFAMVRDRVGAVDRFWHAKRDASGS